jgi:hypothetical protein
VRAEKPAAKLTPKPGPFTWQMRCLDGEEVEVRLEADQLLLGPDLMEPVVIPVRDITRLIYRPVSWRRSREVKKAMAETAGLLADPACDPTSCPQLVAQLLTAELVILPFAHALKTTQHYLEIRWEENGFEQTTTLRVHKRDIRTVLAELARATGREPETRQETFEDQRRREEQGWAEQVRHLHPEMVIFDRGVWIGPDELKPGRYYYAVLEDKSGREVMCLFTNFKPDPTAIVAEVEVELVYPSDGSTLGPVYGEQRGESYLREIRLEDRVFRVKQAPDRFPNPRPAENPFASRVVD